MKFAPKGVHPQPQQVFSFSSSSRKVLPYETSWKKQPKPTDLRTLKSFVLRNLYPFPLSFINISEQSVFSHFAPRSVSSKPHFLFGFGTMGISDLYVSNLYIFWSTFFFDLEVPYLFRSWSWFKFSTSERGLIEQKHFHSHQPPMKRPFSWHSTRCWVFVTWKIFSNVMSQNWFLMWGGRS